MEEECVKLGTWDAHLKVWSACDADFCSSIRRAMCWGDGAGIDEDEDEEEIVLDCKVAMNNLLRLVTEEIRSFDGLEIMGI